MPFSKSKSPSDAITSSFSFIKVSSISKNFSMNGYFVYAYKISRSSMLNHHKHLRYVQILAMLKTLFTSIWESTIPHTWWVTNPTLKKCCSWAFQDANGSRQYSLMTFHILKWIYCFFISDKVMFTLVFMRSYKLVNSIVWDVKLGAFSFTLIEYNTFMHRQGGGTTFVSCIHSQFEKPSPCQHIEWPTTNLCKWHLTSLSTYSEFCMFKKKL